MSSQHLMNSFLLCSLPFLCPHFTCTYITVTAHMWMAPLNAEQIFVQNHNKLK